MRPGRAGRLRGRQHQGRRRRARPAISTPASRPPPTSSKATYSDAGADARLPRDARLRLRVGRRQADRVGLDAGRPRQRAKASPRRCRSRRRTCASIMRIHGRRIRQQVRAATSQGVVCAKLAKAAGAPVKLMLDRKEEHLVGRQPPVVVRRRSRPASTRDGKLVGVRRGDVGHRRRRAGRGLPAAVHLHVPEPPPQAPDVYTNAGPAARDARARAIRRAASSPRSLMDELADKAPDGSARACGCKNLPPPKRRTRCGAKYFPIGAEKIGWSKRHPTGDPAPGPIKRGMGCAANQWGGGGRGTNAATARSTPTAASSMRMRHAGHRHRHAHARRDGRRPRRWGCRSTAVKAEIGDSNYPFAAAAAAASTVGIGLAGDPRHGREGARRALRAAWRRSWASSRPRSSRRTAASS